MEKAVTTGDPRLLERLIGNLVENAIRHNVPNGWLRVTTGQTAERVWLHVANGGAVIANSEVDALFEPFRRGGRVRTATRGAGLGLAIVRLIVDAHGGKMQAKAPPFGGLAIRIELPRAGTVAPPTRMARTSAAAESPPARAGRAAGRAADPAAAEALSPARLRGAAGVGAMRWSEPAAVRSICHGRRVECGEPGPDASSSSGAGGSQARRRMTSEASRFCARTSCSSASSATTSRHRARRAAATGSRSRHREAGGMPSPLPPVRAGSSSPGSCSPARIGGEPARDLAALTRPPEDRHGGEIALRGRQRLGRRR